MLVRDAEQIAQWPQVLFNQPRLEAVVTGGNRSVRGEAHLLRDPVAGFMEVQALVLHAILDCLKQRESAVALVEVQHPRRDAHRLQRAEAADTQQNLLADASAAIAAIEP